MFKDKLANSDEDPFIFRLFKIFWTLSTCCLILFGLSKKLLTHWKIFLESQLDWSNSGITSSSAAKFMMLAYFVLTRLLTIKNWNKYPHN